MENEKNDTPEKATDADIYAHKLALADLLREPAIRSAIQALKLPPGSRGLDAGCGIGSHTLLLAEAVEPGGQVIGLDLSSEILVIAREIAKKSGMSEQVSFQEGDVNRLPFDDDTFDWVWSVDCVGYYRIGEPLTLVKELARVVKPGGSIAILFWSSQQLLPGYPLLEARLNATSAGIAPFVKDKGPELHFLRALGWFHEARLKEPGAQTFVGDVHAPFNDDIRSALISLFQMRWGEVKSELSQEDWEEYQRLSQPESQDFILNLPDYYAFFTYSLFSGRVAQ
ncbi:MAG: methyltransferase domain-containing protein [Deltaproteobacteria bacterium]|nr:methyltransferase domain-containing protein [Deltaproteobacteria bacterium]